MCVSKKVSKMHKKIPSKQFTFTWEHTSQKSIQIKLLQSSLYLKTAARGKVIAKNVAFAKNKFATLFVIIPYLAFFNIYQLVAKLICQ